MTPRGVEHGCNPDPDSWLLNVEKPMTPRGVEHYAYDVVTNERTRGEADDAERR